MITRTINSNYKYLNFPNWWTEYQMSLDICIISFDISLCHGSSKTNLYFYLLNLLNHISIISQKLLQHFHVLFFFYTHNKIFKSHEWKRNTLLSVSAWKILGEPNGRSETLYTLRVRKSGGKNTKNTFPAQGGWSENRFDVKSSPLSSAFSVEERLNGLVTPRRKEWSRQPQSCLSAIRLTGLGSQSKKRPCPALARNVNTVCACLCVYVRACVQPRVHRHASASRTCVSLFLRSW